jgi:hypothetical protein
MGSFVKNDSKNGFAKRIKCFFCKYFFCILYYVVVYYVATEFQLRVFRVVISVTELPKKSDKNGGVTTLNLAE